MNARHAASQRDGLHGAAEPPGRRLDVEGGLGPRAGGGGRPRVGEDGAHGLGRGGRVAGREQRVRCRR